MPNTSNNSMNFGDAAKLLKTFFTNSPYKKDELLKRAVQGAGLMPSNNLPPVTIDPLLIRRNKLYVALICGYGDFEKCEFWNDDAPITEALWYTATKKQVR
jgi:hypothetical protein